MPFVAVDFRAARAGGDGVAQREAFRPGREEVVVSVEDDDDGDGEGVAQRDVLRPE